MRTGRESSNVGEIEILGNQKPAACLRFAPYSGIGIPRQALFGHGIDIMAQCGQSRGQRGWNVLTQLDLHAIFGTGGTGKSSSANAAAKAMTACTSSAESVGKSTRMSAMVAPSAKLAKTVRSVTRDRRGQSYKSVPVLVQAPHGIGPRGVPAPLAITRGRLLPAGGTSPSALSNGNFGALHVCITRYPCTSPAVAPTHLQAYYQAHSKARYWTRG
jgi:hypothetical protein